MELTKKEIKDKFLNSNNKLIGKLVLKSGYTKEILTSWYHNVDLNCKCGNQKKLISFQQGFAETCSSRKCKYWIELNYNKIKETKIRNGTLCSNPEIIKKSKQTKLERYGDENFNNPEKNRETCIKNNSNEIRVQKIYNTKLEKYGDGYYFDKEKMRETKRINNTLPGSKNIIEKIRETKIKNNTFRTSEKVQIKIKETKHKRYNNKNHNNPEKIRETKLRNYLEKFKDIKQLNYEEMILLKNNLFKDYYNKENKLVSINEIADKFEISYSHAQKTMYNLGLNTPFNSIELEVFKTFQEYKCIKTRKIIKPLEIDLYFEEYNLGLEINGIMWHSFGNSIYKQFNNIDKLDKNIHLKKTLLCESQNIKLIHFFDIHWNNPIKRKIIESKIKEQLDNTIIIRCDNLIQICETQASEFLYSNNLDGFINAEKYYGFYYNNELLQVIMLNGKEIDYCNKVGFSVYTDIKGLLCINELIYKADRGVDLECHLDGFEIDDYTEPEIIYYNTKTKEIINNKINEDLRITYNCGKIIYKSKGI